MLRSTQPFVARVDNLFKIRSYFETEEDPEAFREHIRRVFITTPQLTGRYYGQPPLHHHRVYHDKFFSGMIFNLRVALEFIYVGNDGFCSPRCLHLHRKLVQTMRFDNDGLVYEIVHRPGKREYIECRPTFCSGCKPRPKKRAYFRIYFPDPPKLDFSKPHIHSTTLPIFRRIKGFCHSWREFYARFVAYDRRARGICFLEEMTERGFQAIFWEPGMPGYLRAMQDFQNINNT